MLDIKICESITKLVEKLAISGKQEIDKNLFKQFVSYAGQSEEYIKFSLERIFQHLRQNHSEIRLGAFFIVDELFRRSHYFREILLDDFHSFLELTVESNASKLLPPPLPAAKALKQNVLRAIHKWYSKFGDEHKRLALSYNFLKNNLKVDFQDALQRNASELFAVAQEQERQANVIQKKIDGVQTELNDSQDEIVRVITEMDNCFCLLIPKPEHAFEDNNNEDEEPSTSTGNNTINLREHGFSTTTLSIQIDNSNLGNVVKTDDNLPIIENLRDLYTLLKNRYLTIIKRWVTITSKSANQQALFRKIMDLKTMVDKQIERFNLIKVCQESSRNRHDQNSSSTSSSSEEDDSDFEDVPEKEGFESQAISSPVLSASIPSSSSTSTNSKSIVNKNQTSSTCSSSSKSQTWSLWDVQKEDANDPTTFSATLKSLQTDKNDVATNEGGGLPLKNITTTTTIPSSTDTTNNNSQDTSVEATRKRKLLKIAPKLPYDIDLYHWEDKDLKAPSVEIVETDGHKFWTPSQDRAGEVIDDPDGVASLRTRVIEFSGKFEPVKWSCRAPMPSGILCPRRDRLKCPLHGKIIGRDILGNPTNPEDIQRLKEAKEIEESNKPPEWQDPEFLREIEAATGMDLTIAPPKKGKKKKKSFAEMYPGLTDIDKKRNTPRTRLEKKVFNKTSMKRVAQTMDEQSEKRFRDKFGDQWNYSMNDD